MGILAISLHLNNVRITNHCIGEGNGCWIPTHKSLAHFQSKAVPEYLATGKDTTETAADGDPTIQLITKREDAIREPIK